MNLVHATLLAATIVAVAQAHEGFVDSYAAAAATVPAVQATVDADKTSVEPTGAKATGAQGGDAAPLGGLIAVSSLPSTEAPALR